VAIHGFSRVGAEGVDDGILEAWAGVVKRTGHYGGGQQACLLDLFSILIIAGCLTHVCVTKKETPL
jgi:hypothetical protein